jgi:flagellin
MERLSTGKRINGAGDDAAGLQIANRMTAEIQGLKMATRNAADAQSLLTTAEGSMEEVHTILLRLREVAVQAANGTNTLADRRALDSEVQELEAEIDRISNQTTWGGLQLLDSTMSDGVTFQIGVDSGHTMTHSLIEMASTAASIGLSAANGVSTQALAISYIAIMDNAISAVGTERERVASNINRLDHVMANLENVATNLQVSKGRIEDADFAAETANLARTQVLQQASMAMLSQANAAKQNILSLFQ